MSRSRFACSVCLVLISRYFADTFHISTLIGRYSATYNKICTQHLHFTQVMESNRIRYLNCYFETSEVEPGYGGYWPGDPDAEKFNVTLKSHLNGISSSVSVMVPNDRYIFRFIEEQGIELKGVITLFGVKTNTRNKGSCENNLTAITL